jgi:hypothetical protein
VRGRDDLSVELDELGDAGLERILGLQQRGVAARPMAEAEVLPHRHAPRAEPLDELAGDEVLGRLLGALAVERDHDELLDAELGDQLRLGLQRGEQLRRGVGRYDGARVRLERQHGVGAADDLAVAYMDAVELADGDIARAPLRVGEPGDVHQMVARAASAAAWAWTVDAGRRTAKRHSGSATGRFGGWRSSAAGRGQAGVGAVREAII